MFCMIMCISKNMNDIIFNLKSPSSVKILVKKFELVEVNQVRSQRADLTDHHNFTSAYSVKNLNWKKVWIGWRQPTQVNA